MTESSSATGPRFCSECGTQLLPNAAFCHSCGAPVGGGRAPGAEPAAPISPVLRWGLPAVAVLALIILVFFRLGASSQPAAAPVETPLAAGAPGVPDISQMSPTERADRLFNRVMSLASDGKADSAAFFAPMAISSIEALAPLTAHSRYDLGLVALAGRDVEKAAAQSDTILKERPTHLLGLVLAARVADARGDTAAAKTFRKRLLDAEKAERANTLPEYRDHDADLRAAIAEARSR